MTKSKRAEHPLTAALVDSTGYIPKVSVLTNQGRMVTRRPQWIAKWDCWCVRDTGWMEIEPNAGRTYPRYRFCGSGT